MPLLRIKKSSQTAFLSITIRSAPFSYFIVIAKSSEDCVSVMTGVSLETNAIPIPFSSIYSIFILSSFYQKQKEQQPLKNGVAVPPLLNRLTRYLSVLFFGGSADLHFLFREAQTTKRGLPFLIKVNIKAGICQSSHEKAVRCPTDPKGILRDSVLPLCSSIIQR